jgi:regulator of protease activity HflC (stomatin/prohibitin superfamily)
MSSTNRFVVGIIALIVAVFALSSTFVVQQTQQALVFRFGSVARAPITAI